MTDITSNNWTKVANEKIFSLAKIANDMLDLQGQEPSSEGAQAGPQEVFDALSAIIDELTQVQSSIPADNAAEQPGQPPAAAPVPDEEKKNPVVAKLQVQVAELTKKLEDNERLAVAEEYSELFPNQQVAQQKYDEVLKSTESLDVWNSKIAAIQEYGKVVGNSNYRPAKTESFNIKTAKLTGFSNELTHL